MHDYLSMDNQDIQGISTADERRYASLRCDPGSLSALLIMQIMRDNCIYGRSKTYSFPLNGKGEVA